MTHCAVGGIAGVAIANFGWREVKWGTLAGVAWWPEPRQSNNFWILYTGIPFCDPSF
jgi:hypothetical protein